MLLGLKSAKEEYPCVKCWWSRHFAYNSHGRMERVIASFANFHQRGIMDVRDWPMVDTGDVHCVYQCGMHAIIPFGKDLCEFIFNHLQQNPCSMSQLNQWLRKHHINVDFSYLILIYIYL